MDLENRDEYRNLLKQLIDKVRIFQIFFISFYVRKLILNSSVEFVSLLMGRKNSFIQKKHESYLYTSYWNDLKLKK
jgi:hypothetical protein